MVHLYPRVSKLDFIPDEEYIFKQNMNAFFIDDKVNVFTAFKNKNVDFSLEGPESADIIYSLNKDLKPQSYELKIKDKVYITYGDSAGAYYASVTLNQMFAEDKVECCEIFDEPAVEIRGLMFDISRTKVAKVETIKKVLDMMASLKMNHFELYVEGFSFEYKSFPQYLKEDCYITVEEFLELQKYANERFIDFVGNQNGFGHMTDWLEKEELADLRNCPNGSYIWGRYRKASTLNPLKEESVELLKKMYADMLPYSNSEYFNMNFDEPFELGKDATEKICEEKGLGNVYIDFALKAYEIIKSYNKKPIIWGDVLIKHKDLLHRLPKDMIFVDWGYDADYKFKSHARSLAKRDIKFMCAPGTTSWCTWSTRTFDWYEQITNAVQAVKEFGGLGVLLTDWGDYGHHQFWPMSYAPLVYCALYSWGYRPGTLTRVKDYLNEFIFKDENKLMASWMLDFGNYYYFDSDYYHNQTNTFRSFMWSSAAITDVGKDNKEAVIDYYKSKIQVNDLSLAKYRNFKAYFKYKLESLEYVNLRCDDKDLVIAECKQSIKMLSMIQDLTMSMSTELTNKEKIDILKAVILTHEEIINEQKRLWLARNKVSDLNRSIGYIEKFYEFVKIMIEYLDKEGEKV